jgi:hypothetical protein
MVWSVHASAWDAGLAVARSYAGAHGHFLPPTSAVWGGDGFPIGVWAKNQRAAARKTRENAVRRARGETGISSAGELSQSRMEALEEIDPGWPPEWEIGWQRLYRLALAHVKAGGTLPTKPGEVVVQGEDLAVWIAGQRAGWDRLKPAQQYLLETPGVDPDHGQEEARPTRRSQDELWERNMAAARQFHAREGHLRVPRQHREHVDGETYGLGSFVANARRRAAKITPEQP